MVRLFSRLSRPKREEVTRGWKNFTIFTLPQILFGLIFWVITSARLRWAAHLTLMGEGRIVFKTFVGNLRGGDCIGCENNIKIFLQGIGYENVK
jgi:hypothetical protein